MLRIANSIACIAAFISLSGFLGCRTVPRAPPSVAKQTQAAPAAEAQATAAAVAADHVPAPPAIPSAAPENKSQIRLVKHEQPAPDAVSGVEPLPPPGGGEAQPTVSPYPTKYPIDLPTALRLAEADNLQIAFAREQIAQAYAEQLQARVLWLPNLRGGMHWNHHDGPILDSNGNVLQTSRGSMYAGGGANAVGAGSPAIPGVFAFFQLTDAIFQPLAARQRSGARRSTALVTRNDTLLSVSLAYLELLRAAQDIEIALEIYQKTSDLSAVTDAYARSGQGLQSDADRMHVELSLRQNDIVRAQEAFAVASARLAQLLTLEPCLQLEPIDPAVVPLCLVPPGDCCALVAQAQANRPEVAMNRFLVGEAVQRARREQYAPLLPNFWIGASNGAFGGGPNNALADFDNRFDFDANMYWEMRNFGYGEVAARQTTRSRVRQAEIQNAATRVLIAREVSEAYAQVQLRERQIETARRAVQSAEDSYQHNFVRIRQGQGLPIEVLQATNALQQARREYLRTVIDYNASQFTLQRALGWPAGGGVAARP